MKSKLLNKKSIPPACEYCSRGNCAPDGKTVLCPKKGVMQKNSSCSAARTGTSSRISQAFIRQEETEICSYWKDAKQL